MTTTVDAAGDHGVQVEASSTGNGPVLMTLAANPAQLGRRPSAVVIDGIEHEEANQSLTGCEDFPCSGDFVLRFELLHPDGGPVTVTWSATPTTVVRTGEGGVAGIVTVGAPAAAAASPAVQRAVIAGQGLDATHAGAVGVVRIAGPTATLAEVDARLLVSVAPTPGTPHATAAIEVIDPVDGLTGAEGAEVTGVGVTGRRAVELNMEGACDPAGFCERVFWVLVSQQGAGSLAVDVLLDVRGPGAEGLDVDASVPATSRLEAPVELGEAGTAPVGPFDPLPADTTIVAWATAFSPLAQGDPYLGDVVVGPVGAGLGTLTVPVLRTPAGATHGFVILGTCTSPAECPFPLEVTGDLSVFESGPVQLVVELFALVPALEPFVGAIGIGGG